jgi:hypothetical protein
VVVLVAEEMESLTLMVTPVQQIQVVAVVVVVI